MIRVRNKIKHRQKVQDREISDTFINTKRGIKIEGSWIGCEVVRKSDKIARVFVKESVTVPANSEIIIEGTGKQAEYINTRYASLEPFYDDSSHMLVARCLVDPFNDIIPVRVANLTTKHRLDS
jgi:hypothetical protein